MSNKNSKKSRSSKNYSSGEKRAYWIGVGSGITGDDNVSLLANLNFKNYATLKEMKSFQNGLVAPIHDPYMFKRLSKKRADVKLSKKNSADSKKNKYSSERVLNFGSSKVGDYSVDAHGNIKGKK